MSEIPIPKKMRGLTKDRRGYPIPFNVLRDLDGKPHFAITDTIRQHKVLVEGRCPICGYRLDKLMWFVGGPLSAFHPNGAYNDTALHHECMRYALQVCPYLALPNYLGRVDARTVDPKRLPKAMKGYLDITQIPERPPLFVAVAAKSQTIVWRPVRSSVKPQRPYLDVEYWLHGKQLTIEEAKPIVDEALSTFAEPVDES